MSIVFLEKGESGMDYAARRRAQAAQTEQDILQAALALMRTRGFDHVSIRDICRQAGITTGAFYHHFASKEDLFSKGFSPMDLHMEQALKGHEDLPPVERLQLILLAYVSFMEENGALIGRYYQRRLVHPNSAPPIDPSRYTLRAMLGCFRQAQEEGILAGGHSPEWVADFCFRHFRGVVIDWILYGHSYPLKERMLEDFALFRLLFQAH